MLLEFSHILAFSALFVNSLFDVFSEKGDVPSEFSLIAIIGGILLHGAYAFSLGSVTPFVWMLGIGVVFSLYGWFAYWMGMWGGADALAMTVLGFAAPYSVSGVGMVYGFSLFVNIFLVSSVYALFFTLYKIVGSVELKRAFMQRLSDNRRLIGAEFLVIVIFSSLQSSLMRSFAIFGSMSVLLLFYHLSKEVEDVEMSRNLSVSEVEVGDVIDTEGIDIGRSRERNLIGLLFQKVNVLSGERLSKTRFSVIEEKLGYSEIVGVTEKEIRDLKDQGVENVSIKEGLRLIPVFPIALVLTEAGFTFVRYISLL